MKPPESEAFQALLAGVYAFYSKDLSQFAITVWWEAMKPYGFDTVNDALNRHCVNPDGGQWLPKPADVVRLIAGGTQDAALVAWAKVDRALRHVGPYQSVCFDDQIINAVLSDMGGWVQLGTKSEDEWPFVAKEFENRYRGYRLRGKLTDYPRYLAGITECHNSKEGFEMPLPVLIGDPLRAELVLRHGGDGPRIGFTPLKLPVEISA